MADQTLGLSRDLADYLRRVGVREHPVLAALRAETAALPLAVMQISPEQGQFMAMLVRLTGARRCLEVGTFTGYSATVCALALPEDGRLTALDVSEEWTAIARRYWQQAGVAHKIDLRLGPAADSLRSLLPAGEGSYDFLFIDADKPNYATYYELGLRLVRPGGLIAFDNVLWGGLVADPAVTDESTVALRALNLRLQADDRVDICMVPIGDGVTLARRRP
jgi:predicted O-methyltransferase YrrM